MIYKRLQVLCKERGESIAGLERELGFSRGSLYKLNTSNPNSERIQSLAKHFNVSVEYLMTGKEIPKESVSGKVYYFNDETAEMAQALYEQPGQRMLFDASKDSKPEDLKMAADLLKRLKETNPDG